MVLDPPPGFPPFKAIVPDEYRLPVGCWPVPFNSEWIAGAMGLVWSSMGVYVDSPDAHPLGTCFMVADGIALTASHCVNVVKEMLERDGVRHPDGEHRLNLGVIDAETLNPIMVVEVGEFPGTDLMLLYLQMHPRMKDAPLPKRLTTRLSPLLEGEKLQFGGYPFTGSLIDREATRIRGEEVVTFVGDAMWGTGSVATFRSYVEHPNPHSCIFVEGIEAPSGMSGGPVFDSRRRIVGLVSRSLEGGNYTMVAPLAGFVKGGNIPPDYLGTITVRLGDGDSFDVDVDNT